MVVEYIHYKIESERQKEFEDAYEQAGRSLNQCVKEPKSYVLRIEWDSQNGHLKGFRTSPEFQTFFEAVRPFFNDVEEMHQYEVTKVMRSRERSTSIS